ncbi:SpaA isopeptide-forming pilin-related protein [Enterococcus devriesei]|uniref:SpaA isopeptide-forming pilin-related protein n=1 Tax=Enterococcus devriesei TaxID=319970 RepID=UPI0036D3025D
MKRWVNIAMLLTLVGNFAAPLTATAVDTTSSSGPINGSNTVETVAKNPQSTVPTESAPVPEKTSESEKPVEITNQLEFDKASELKNKQVEKDSAELTLMGKITSSAENTQPISFEITKAFTLSKIDDDKKIILNDQKETIGEYSVDESGDRNKLTLNFNKLAKGENRFRMILLGTITRGPDQTVDFYQENQKIFQLTLPDPAESASSTTSETVTTTQKSEESTQTSSEKTSSSNESTEKTSSSSEKESTETSVESTDDKKALSSQKKETTIKPQAEEARQPGPIDDLFTQFAPGDNFVKNIDLNFNPNPPTINSDVNFNLDFNIPDAVRTEMVPGDYYEMDFPEGLTITNPSPKGNLVDDDGTIYGTYIFDAATQKLRITFTQQEGEEFFPPENGSVDATVKFDQQKIGQPGKTTIIYPSKTNIPPLTVKIKPTGGTAIDKSGHTDVPNNPNKVIWNVDFNKNFADLTNPLITENFPNQVTFDKNETGSVAVYPLNVDFNGNVVGTSPTPVDSSQYSVADNGSIQFNTPLDSAYRIVYVTTIKDSVKPNNGGQLTATNNVNLKSGTINVNASASVTLNYKKALEKAQTGYDRINQIYSWVIRYNYGQKELANDTVVSDTYSSNMDLDPNSFKIYTVNFNSSGTAVNGAPLNPSDYTINTATNPFTVTFKNNVQAGKAINIEYKTKVNAIVNNNSAVTVTNQAQTNNLPPTPITSTKPAQQVIIKNKPTIDVGSKTARYLIDINKNKYEMDNTVFTDIMKHSQDGYLTVPFKVKNPTDNDGGVIIRDVSAGNKVLAGAFQILAPDGTPIISTGDVNGADYLVQVHTVGQGVGYKDFTVKFQNSYAKTSHQFQMEYYIGYNQFSENNVPNPNTSVDYQNSMSVDFTNNNTPYTSSYTADFKTTTQEANQGMKSGSYNPVTKEITWTIVTNYNNAGVSLFNVKDPITGNQVYEPNSLTVTRGTINSSGNFVATTDTNYSGNQVGKDYLTVTDPVPTGEDAQGTLELQVGDDGNYIPGWNVTGAPLVFQIQFKTSLKDKIVYNQSEYANTATTEIAGVQQQLPASVSIAFGGQSAIKAGNYNTQSGLIDWTLNINPNQSLLANVKIEDTPSSNQILQESFKLYTGKYAGSGSSTTVQPDQLVPAGQYQVKVTTDPATGQQSFSVDMSEIQEKPDPNNPSGFLTGVIERPYVLVYSTEPSFTSRTETVTNDATISSEGKELPGKDTQKSINVTIQDSSGTAYGTKGKILLQKVDKNDAIVPGAVLQLIRKNIKTGKTDVLYQTTTDSQGMATFGNLIGTSSAYEYTVKEIEAPNGYTISPELLAGKKVTVNTSSNPPTTPIENEQIKVQFNKTDVNGKTIAGGLFSLFQNSGTSDEPNYTLLRTLTPTNQGVDLSGLGDGQYRIQEVVAPDGYQINQTLIDFEVKQNDNNTRGVFVNGQQVTSGVLQLKDYQGSALLKKTTEAGTNLAGAQFNVQRADSNSDNYTDFGTQSEYVTNSDGQLKLDNLPPGKYKVKERTAPTNYYLNSKEFDFVIDPISASDQAPATIQLNDGNALVDYQGTARFKKIDGNDYSNNQTVTPLAGAKFQLYDATGQTALGGVVTSGADGYFVFAGLAPGTTYSFKETQAPTGYLINSQVVRFTTPTTGTDDADAVTIDSADQKLVVDEQTPFQNYKERARFQKIDAAGEALGGAKYQLQQNINDQWQPVTNPVNGADSDGLFTSDASDGYVWAYQLPPGSYKFVEKTAPQGYLLNTLEIPFVVQNQAEGAPEILEIPISGDANVNYQGSAQLYKEAENTADNAFSKLVDANFDVYTDTASPQKVSPADGIDSDSDGNVTIKNLAPGNYYFQEVSNGGDYLINTQKIKFAIPNNAAGKPTVVTTNSDTAPGEKLTLRNYLGSVELMKVDPNDQPLKGATFTVYDSSGAKAGSGDSDQAGKVTINKLAPGRYTMKETQAPANYLINDRIVSFTIPNSAEGQPQVVEIANAFKNYQGSVRLIKTNASNQRLAGAEFQLLDQAGHPVGDNVTSNAQGEVQFNNLAPGTYTFKEITAPNGYLLNTATVDVTVPKDAEDQPSVVTVSDHFINYQGSAQLTKTDSDDNPLVGAKFKVVDAQGADVPGKTATSNNDGIVSVSGLAPGDYRFVETEAPNKGTSRNYIMSGEALEFTIPATSENQPATVKLADDVVNYRGTIRLHKIGNDIDNESKMIDIQGAEFTLYRDPEFQDTTTVKTITGADGIAEFTDLAPGTYYVKETKAPSGYLLNTFPLTFVIPERVPATMPMTDEQNHLNKIEDGAYVVDAGDFHNFTKEIELTKSDGEDPSEIDFSKVTFSLYVDNGSSTGELVKEDIRPDENGSIDLSTLALEDGCYKLVETSTSPGYLVSGQPIYFVVTGDQTSGIDFTLTNYQASVEGKKVNRSNKGLGGAEYKIFKADDPDETAISTTDKAGKSQSLIETANDGSFYAKGLSAGDYFIQEVTAPTGYIRDTTKHPFTIYPQSGEPATLNLGEFENYQGSAKLIKQADSGKLLAGATFEVREKGGPSVGDMLTTNDDGEVTVKGLAPGDYQFVETSAPDGYLINTTPVDFSIEASNEGQPAVVVASDDFVNYQGSARFRKTDAKKDPLPGAQFQVEDKNGDSVGEVIDSDNDGYVTVENLAPGDYKFVEVTAPTGYLLNQTEIDFTIPEKAAGKPEQVKANNGADFINYKGSAILRKTDISNNKLVNAEFKVVDEAGNKVGDTIISNPDGEVIANGLAPGKYAFVEEQAPAGYLINTDPVPFEIATEASGEPEQVKANDGENFINYKGSVQLKKVAFDRSEADQGLEGATFIVQDEKGDQVGNAVGSDKDGLVTVKNLAPGNYYLIEETAPEGFVINTQKIPFTIADHAAGEPKIVQANNDQPFANYKGTVQLIKQGVDGQRLPKAEFDLFKEGETEAFKRGTTDANGVMTLSGLAPGNYKLEEVFAPAGYIVNKTPIEFTIAASTEGQPAVVIANDNFINYQGSAKLIKQNKAGTPLKGAEFEVLDEDGERVGDPIKSNDNGEVLAENLAPGDYEFKELTAPEGYLLNTTTVPFTIAASSEDGKQDIIISDPFVNYQGSVKLTKQNVKGDKLAGAVFELFRKGSDEVIQTGTTGEDGVLNLTDLAPGDYELIEKIAPAGYIINETPIEFTIDASAEGKPDDVTAADGFINYQGSATLIKQNAKGDPLEGAEFEVLNKDGNRVGAPIKSNGDGEVFVENLEPGDYEFKEITAPEGYLLNTATVPFTIAQSSEKGKQEIDVSLVDYQGSVRLIKKDVDGNKLEGAEFELFKEGSDKAIQQKETDKNGVLSMAGLVPGNYRLIEKTAPDGYIINKTPIEFTIDASAEGQPAVVMANDNFINYQGTAKLIKQNAEGTPLEGAEFKVFDRKTNKQVGKTIRSDDEGIVTAMKLAPGKYYFQESKAPTSYVRNTAKVYFEIPESALGQPSLVQFVDPVINYRGQVQLTKVDADDASKHLANAEFQLLDENKKVIKQALKTNEEGNIAVADLAPGKYFFMETEAPSGYQLTQKLVEFTISESAKGKQEQVQVKAENRIIPKTPNTPNKPNKPNKPASPKKPQTPKQGFYPKTGEERNSLLLIIGGFIVVLATAFYLIKRHKNK